MQSADPNTPINYDGGIVYQLWEGSPRWATFTEHDMEVLKMMIIITAPLACIILAMGIATRYMPGRPEYEKRIARQKAKNLIKADRERFARNPQARATEE